MLAERMIRFASSERSQPFLLPPDLKGWVREDDLARFVIEAVERVDIAAYKVNVQGSGSEQYHPRLMPALVIYCYANGILDKFHAVKFVNDAVDKVRREESKSRPELRGSRYSWLKNPFNLSSKQAAVIDTLAYTDLKTARAYRIRLAFQEMLASLPEPTRNKSSIAYSSTLPGTPAAWTATPIRCSILSA
jgi:hypothetical protein